MKLAGIDYGITSPAITIFEGEKKDFSFKQCTFHSLSDHKITNTSKFKFYLHEKWDCEQQRYDNISMWAMSLVDTCDFVAIEGYSMASKGKVFNLAENCGVLKHVLWMLGIPMEIVPPTRVKKVAGKGNATKDTMYDYWLKETGYNLKDKFQPTRKLGSPTTDIVDSYYICKYLVTETI